MERRVYADAAALTAAAAELFRARVSARPELTMAVLVPDTVAYILTDDVVQGDVCGRAVSLGVQTILAAREVVVLVSGAGKRAALRAALDGPVTPEVPASILQLHPNCVPLADRAAAG